MFVVTNELKQNFPDMCDRILSCKIVLDCVSTPIVNARTYRVMIIIIIDGKPAARVRDFLALK